MFSFDELQNNRAQNPGSIRALDKREYLVIIRDNFREIGIKTYVVTTHLNRLEETFQMRGHNIWFE